MSQEIYTVHQRRQILAREKIHIKGLLTEREICSVKSRTEVLKGLKKTKVRYFTVQTEQARSMNCLLHGYK